MINNYSEYNFPFYAKYFLDKEMLDDYTTNLAFNLVVHACGEELKEKTQKMTFKTLLPAVNQIKKQAVKKILAATAMYCLTPLGLDHSTVNGIINHVVMPNLSGVITENKAQDARTVYNFGANVLEATGGDAIIKGNFYAWGVVCAEELSEQGATNKIVPNLRDRLLTYFEVDPYLSINPAEEGFSVLYNLVNNVYVFACKILCYVHLSIEGESAIIALFQQCLEQEEVYINLEKVSKDLDQPAILSEKYYHAAVPMLRFGRTGFKAARNIYNAAVSFLPTFG